MKYHNELDQSIPIWRTILPIIISICALSCSSTISQPQDYGKDYILFGDGGGFAGMVTTYALYENGQMMVRNHGDTIYQSYGKVKSKTARQLLDNYFSQGISELKLNTPANTYYFLESHQSTENSNRIVYDPYAKGIPTILENYIHTLNGLLRKIKAEETSEI